MLKVFENASSKLQEFIISVLHGNNFYYVEKIIDYANSEYGDSKHLYCLTGFNVGGDRNKLIGVFNGTNGRVNVLYYQNLIEEGIIEV